MARAPEPAARAARALPAGIRAARDARRLIAVLIANGLLRVANSAGGALAGFYLAHLARQGKPVDATILGA